ncbi:MAG: hypothetical protein ACYCO5_10615 [Acidobacteriaceae bacterium]
MISASVHLSDGSSLRHATQTIAQKLAERRIYRPLVIIPGDRVGKLLDGTREYPYGAGIPDAAPRALAAIADSSFFAPFFLFVSWIIERMLEHAFDDEAAVEGYILDVGTGAKRVPSLDSATSQRVLFWATPYKQLYKDPALLVRVSEKAIATLDDIGHAEKDKFNISAPLHRRIRAGLTDSETKYEALWKLYVFISDGLFYSGVVAKLRPEHLCSENHKNHLDHLHVAQDYALRALRAAWEYWASFSNTVEFAKPMPPSILRELCLSLVNDKPRYLKNYSKLRGDVCTIRLDRYVHGSEDTANCRDVRYKTAPIKISAPKKILIECGMKEADAELLIDII